MTAVSLLFTATSIKKEVLEKLICRELLYQTSQKKGIKIDEAAINEQLTALKKRFPSEAEFNNALTKRNLSEAAIKSQLERNVAIKEFVVKITIPDGRPLITKTSCIAISKRPSYPTKLSSHYATILLRNTTKSLLGNSPLMGDTEP